MIIEPAIQKHSSIRDADAAGLVFWTIGFKAGHDRPSRCMPAFTSLSDEFYRIANNSTTPVPRERPAPMNRAWI